MRSLGSKVTRRDERPEITTDYGYKGKNGENTKA